MEQGLSSDTAALPQPALGEIRSHKYCLPGRNCLLAAFLPAGAGHIALVLSRDRGRMGHNGVGCETVPTGAISSQDKSWMTLKRSLLLIPQPLKEPGYLD